MSDETADWGRLGDETADWGRLGDEIADCRARLGDEIADCRARLADLAASARAMAQSVHILGDPDEPGWFDAMRFDPDTAEEWTP